jgi:ubiquinone/menaquinone biosynthesis C-methylase UbiE
MFQYMPMDKPSFVETYMQGVFVEEVSPMWASMPAAVGYDVQYIPFGKDYAHEAAFIHSLIQERVPGAQSLLDVACGTGSHLVNFGQLGYDPIAGLDQSNANLQLAAHKLQSTEDAAGAVLVQGDMAGFELDDQYSVVTNLFGALGHLTCLEDLSSGIRAMVEHAKPGGLVILEPFLTPAEWRGYDLDNSTRQHASEADGVHITRTTVCCREGSQVHMRMHYTVAQQAHPDEPVRVDMLVEDHPFRLHTRTEIHTALRGAGVTQIERIAPPQSIPVLRELVIAQVPG